mmetsp:Transcript_20503/g.44835  ORF Transcript_20503/g.44835 Transcript_20503/m.44835 type:complete len:200 (+) Transcript_20503:234-833(+)
MPKVFTQPSLKAVSVEAVRTIHHAHHTPYFHVLPAQHTGERILRNLHLVGVLLHQQRAVLLTHCQTWQPQLARATAPPAAHVGAATAATASLGWNDDGSGTATASKPQRADDAAGARFGCCCCCRCSGSGGCGACSLARQLPACCLPWHHAPAWACHRGQEGRSCDRLNDAARAVASPRPVCLGCTACIACTACSAMAC